MIFIISYIKTIAYSLLGFINNKSWRRSLHCDLFFVLFKIRFSAVKVAPSPSQFQIFFLKYLFLYFSFAYLDTLVIKL